MSEIKREDANPVETFDKAYKELPDDCPHSDYPGTLCLTCGLGTIDRLQQERDTLARRVSELRVTVQGHDCRYGEASADSVHCRPGYLCTVCQVTALAQRVVELEEAVRWALGEVGKFSPPFMGIIRRRFWWRTELRQRAFPPVRD